MHFVLDPMSKLLFSFCNWAHMSNFLRFSVGDANTYVYSVKGSSDGLCIGTSTSNNQIHVVDAANLTPLLRFDCHTRNQITDFDFIDTSTLFSCGSDAEMHIWDLRTKCVVPSMTFISSDARQRAFLSCSVNSSGDHLAAGTEYAKEDAFIHLWDRRSSSSIPLVSIVESLGDDVTQTRFHPSLPNMLCSGSTDGLVCVFDTKALPNEDDALISVMNSESSVSRIGFFGEYYEFLYLTTHIETLSLWSLHSVCLHHFLRKTHFGS